MSTRPMVIAANWKMHKTRDEAVQYADELSAWIDGNLEGEPGSDRVQVIVAPPHVHLDAVIGRSPSFGVFAQDAHQEPAGAFTGETSAPMLADLGCDGVILGHSERRTLSGETSEMVAAKCAAALAAHVRPMICVGETLEERRAGHAERIVEEQLAPALEVLVSSGDGNPQWAYIAYEPVWAIGTGETATAEQAQHMHAAIRGLVVGALGDELGWTLPILYGGSVKPANAHELLSQPDIDGALVGGASLEVESFSEIVDAGRRAATENTISVP